MTVPRCTSATTEQLVRAAQAGDDQARDRVIRRHWQFIGRTAGRVVKRTVGIEDDMWSVALMAFNQAIDAYKEERPASFETFASLVIRRRVIDRIRRRARRRDVPLALFDEGENGSCHPTVLQEARRRAVVVEQGNELAREVAEYRQVLQEFGVMLDDLPDNSPRQRGASERAWAVADLLVKDPNSLHRFITSRQLPLKELTQMPECPVSRQTMERHRAYIVAIAALKLGDFQAIQSVVQDGKTGQVAATTV